MTYIIFLFLFFHRLLFPLSYQPFSFHLQCLSFLPTFLSCHHLSSLCCLSCLPSFLISLFFFLSSTHHSSLSPLQVCWLYHCQTKLKMLSVLSNLNPVTLFGVYIFPPCTPPSLTPSLLLSISPFIFHAVWLGTMLGASQHCRQMVHLLDVHQPSLPFPQLAF